MGKDDPTERESMNLGEAEGINRRECEAPHLLPFPGGRSQPVKTRRVRAEPSGFTLPELLIAALLFTVVALAMGSFYVFTLQSQEEGWAEIELQRNGLFAIEEITRHIREGQTCTIPAEGEPPNTPNSITICYAAEPYEDENLNHQWDNVGATGACAPSECFTDLDGNGRWDSEVNPRISYRVMGNAIEYRIGPDGSEWKKLLDNRYGYASGRSNVYVKSDELIFQTRDPYDPQRVTIKLTIRDDLNTASEKDDLVKNFRITVRSRG